MLTEKCPRLVNSKLELKLRTQLTEINSMNLLIISKVRDLIELIKIFLSNERIRSENKD